MKKFVWLTFKVFIILFILLTIFFTYLSFFHKELLLYYLDKIDVLVESLWYWNYIIIFLFWFIESFPLIWVSVPWQIVLITISWFLGYKHIFLVIWLAFLWAILWNYIWYIMWVKYWKNFFKKYWNRIGIWLTDIKYIKKWIRKHWWLFVIFWKFHSLLRAFVPFIAWSLWMHSLSFTFANILGSLMRAAVMVLLWVFFIENTEIILQHIWKVILFLIILFALYVFFFKKNELKMYIKEREKEMDNIMKKNKT